MAAFQYLYRIDFVYNKNNNTAISL